MKGHFGVDSRSKLIHAVVATPANVADSTVLPRLLHGNETRVGRPGVSRPAGSDPPARTTRAGLCQPPLSPSRYRGRGRAGEKPDQIKGAGESRASDRHHQADLRLRQGTLSWAQKEHSSAARDLRARQPLHRTPASIALRAGVISRAQLPVVADAAGGTQTTAPPLPHCQCRRNFNGPASNRSPLFRHSLT